MQYIKGWWNYLCPTESVNRLRPLAHWVRRRLRALPSGGPACSRLCPPRSGKSPGSCTAKASAMAAHARKYLGAYLFRVAISEPRVLSYDGQEVTFQYRKVGSHRWRKLSLAVIEFMQRFLQHVLPKGFIKLRHFGFSSLFCWRSVLPFIPRQGRSIRNFR